MNDIDIKNNLCMKYDAFKNSVTFNTPILHKIIRFQRISVLIFYFVFDMIHNIKYRFMDQMRNRGIAKLHLLSCFNISFLMR